MPIPKIIQTPQLSLTVELIHQCNRHSKLLRHNTFGRFSPFNVLGKITSLAVKILLFPVFCLCVLTDLTAWSFQTISIYFMCKKGLKQHLIDLIGLIAAPFLFLSVCLVKSPTILNPWLATDMFSLANDQHDNNLLHQSLKEAETNNPYRTLLQPNQQNPKSLAILVEENIIGKNFMHTNYRARYKSDLTELPKHPILLEAILRGDINLFDLLIKEADTNTVYKEGIKEYSILGRLAAYHHLNPEMLTRIFETKDLDINSLQGGDAPIAEALLNENYSFMKQLASQGSHLYVNDLKQFFAFLQAFKLEESKATKNGELYSRTLMAKIASDTYEKNVYFKAVLNHKSWSILDTLFFHREKISGSENPQYFNEFKIETANILKDFKNRIRQISEDIDNIFARNYRKNGIPKRHPLLPKEIIPLIVKYLV